MLPRLIVLFPLIRFLGRYFETRYVSSRRVLQESAGSPNKRDPRCVPLKQVPKQRTLN
jgi:hypothetical protein